MSRFALPDLKDGMVVGRDVVDHGGKVLIPAGSVLSQKHRVVLAASKIHYVEITDESAGLAELLYDEEFMARPAGKKAAPAQPEPVKPMRAQEGEGEAPVAVDPATTQRRLVMLAQMFGEYRDDPLMRTLCRLAIKCAKEGFIGA